MGNLTTPTSLAPLGPFRSVLDVGCGIRPQKVVATQRWVGVDAFQPYLDSLAGEVICSDWRPALRSFAPDSFDLVVALDFIEHLRRREGREFLTAAQRVGRAVCIFTPLGPFPQRYVDGETDAWGMGGGYWQTHRSAWTPKDFEGWSIQVEAGFHTVDAKDEPLPEPIDAFWAVKSTLTKQEEPPVPKRYKVIGTQPILDHKPGKIFTAEIPADQEEFLVGIGGLKVLAESPAEKPAKGQPPKP